MLPESTDITEETLFLRENTELSKIKYTGEQFQYQWPWKPDFC